MATRPSQPVAPAPQGQGRPKTAPRGAAPARNGAAPARRSPSSSGARPRVKPEKEEKPPSTLVLPARSAPAAPSPRPAGELPVAEEVDLDALPDEELMKLCQEGDEGGFEVLFRRYEGPALSFIYRMIGDRSKTDALGQEAFLRIFKEARSYEYPRSFSTWFYTIVRNLCKNELRWRSRHPTVSLQENYSDSRGQGDSEGGYLGDNLSAEAPDPLETLASKELHSKLEEALALLPDSEYELVILKLFQGLKYKEIAEIVNLPVGTVRGRVYAALERLRKAVKKYL